MSFGSWLIYAGFWAVFVLTPGPNAANCIQNGMAFGFARALWGVAAILTQASLFLLLSGLGVAAVIVAVPSALFWMQMAGAALLIWLGLRGWRQAGGTVDLPVGAGSIYLRALFIATLNAKSMAGYIAAFTLAVGPGPIWPQMALIVPTTLGLTALSYIGYTALGAGIGRAAMGAVFNTALRRALAGCFIIYGAALGTAAWHGRLT